MERFTVLYVCHTTHCGGATLSLFNLVRSVKGHVYPIILLPGTGQAYDLFRGNGVECIVVPFCTNVCPTNKLKHYLSILVRYPKYIAVNARCLRIIKKKLSGRDINIVHSNASVFTIGLKIAKMLNVKHVWHLREFQDIDFNIRPYFSWTGLKKKMRSSDAVIAITRSVYEHWGLQGRQNAYWFWDAVRSENDIICNENKEKFFFFCAAYLNEAKGADFAVEAYGLSGLANEGYSLVLAGVVDDNYKNKLNALANEYGVSQNICYAGYCNDIKKYMKDATAFLMCSKNEGLGRVTVEAMFYGCPVIARNTGGTVEFIQDKINGLLFSDIKSCATAMQTIAHSHNCELIKSAQLFAAENFSEEKYGRKILDIYSKLVGINLW